MERNTKYALSLCEVTIIMHISEQNKMKNAFEIYYTLLKQTFKKCRFKVFLKFDQLVLECKFHT